MEVNKEEAARCRDIGAAALRSGQSARAVKMFKKSLYLYPLPGVQALLDQAEKKLQSDEGSSTTSNNNANGTSSSNENNRPNYSSAPSSSSANGFTSSRSSSSASMNNPASSTASTTSSTGADGRAYTPAQEQIVSQVLRAKEGGRGAHYRVLGIEQSADEAAIKKAYRKLALKLHPDKNSAPHADEAFKAVGLAYATLSDGQKRTIYDRYGEEDPDNRGGGMGGMRGRGGNMHFNGQEVNPEDIFNMFFGGGMPGGMGGGMGGPGFRVYTTGMGPGFAFGGMHPNMQRARRQQQQQHQQQQQPDGILGQLVQFLPLLMILFLSFFNMPGQSSGGATGGSRYFSLTPVNPFVNPLHTKFSTVKDIPYFVTDQFVRTIGRDRYQLSQVERMVEESYKRYLSDECKNQKDYKKKLETLAMKRTIPEQERNSLMRKANNFDLTRCIELEELFPHAVPAHSRVKQQHTEF